MVDKLKLLIAVMILIAGMGAFYYFAEYSLLVRVLGLLAITAIAFVVALQSAPGKTALGFVKDSNIERRKVVWPTRSETVRTTAMVIALVIVAAILLWILDSLLLVAVGFLTGQGS
jgi:preprotein translocase subunit SecE